MAIPVLTTERLTLRGHDLESFRHSAAMWASPIVSRYIGGRPSTEEEAWRRFLMYRGHWAYLGFGYWMVQERASGDFVGEVGFARFNRAIEVPFKQGPEIGWVLSPGCHGKGYATEAVNAVTRWADEQFGATPTWCMINPENTASVRVASKCNYRPGPAVSYHGQRSLTFIRQPRS